MTYRVTFNQSRPHPDGGTYLTGPQTADVWASDARTARDTITGLVPGAKIVSVRDLDAAYNARIRRAERSRNR